MLKRIEKLKEEEPELFETEEYDPGKIVDVVLNDESWIEELWIGFQTLEDRVMNFVEEARKLND